MAGKLVLRQPADGYRAGTDPVFLAAAVLAKPGERVLDLGCGVGTAVLCLGVRVGGLELHGLELQADYAKLARANAERAGLALTVHDGDVRAPPDRLRQLDFHHVLLNPPFFAPETASASRDPGRDLAQREAAPLAIWLDTALRRLKERGTVSIIHRTERLSEILAGLNGRAGDISVLPLAGRQGRPAARVIVRARKLSRGPLTLLAPFVIHRGDHHFADRPDFSPEAEAVLAGGAMLPKL